MRVYISGRITGDKGYKEKFRKAYEKLLFHYDVFNPASLDLGDAATWSDYMRYDINELTRCDAIYMLRDWRKSKGARLERFIARKIGLKVFYEVDDGRHR